jgi:hypothetical protein
MEIDLDRIELTELNQITWPHHGRTWNEFSCWSEQMREIFRLTKEQQYTSLDFENLRHSLDPEKRRLYETYKTHYTDHTNNIQAEWNPETNKFRIEKGRHRALYGKVHDLKHLPGKVYCEDMNALTKIQTENRKRFGDEIPRNVIPERNKSIIERKRNSRRR